MQRLRCVELCPYLLGLVAGLVLLWQASWQSWPWGLLLALCVGMQLRQRVLLRRRSKALRETARRLSLLADMNERVNREILLNENIEVIYGTILNYLFSVFNTATTGSVLVLGDDGHLTFAASRGFTEEFVSRFRLRLEDSFLYQVTGGAIRSTRLINRDDFRTVETVIKPKLWAYKSVISAPIFVGDRLFGLLNLDSSVDDTYGEQDVAIVERIRAQIEIALLARDRYTRSMQRYQVDALTGLLTRGYFEDRLAAALQRAQAQQHTVVLAVFDVDGLKEVNDQQGHLAGDHLLMGVANALYATCQGDDIMGRYGGDEFVALYHAQDTALVAQAVNAVRSQLAQHPLLNKSGAIRASFSYGLARFPQDGSDLASLLEVADKDLYAMKFARP